MRYPTMGILFFLLTGCLAAPSYKGPVSDHFDGTNFFNPSTGKSINHGFGDFFRWQRTSHRATWPEKVDITKIKPSRQVAEGEIVITPIGHATVLIQMGALSFLTDPVWSDRVGPLGWVGPRRISDPVVDIADLPPIDIVLISHNHYDHLDLPTIERLIGRDHPLILAGLGNDLLLRPLGANVVALDWWQSLKHKNIEVTFTPSHHWSGRGLTDRSQTLWGSFMIKGPQGRSVYFAGDTAMGPHFKMIYERLGAPTVALLPIGAYEPRWFMQIAHMNPMDAVLAFLDLQATHAIGIHFKTFQLSDESLEQPLKDLQKALEEKKVPAKSFVGSEGPFIF